MPVPTQSELHRPLLEIAYETDNALHTKQYMDAIVSRLSLTTNDLAEMVPSGLQSRIENRVYWGLHYLLKAKLLQRPSKARYQITTAGQEYLSNNSGTITIARLKAMVGLPEPGKTTSPSGVSPSLHISERDSDDSDASPQDKIDSGYRELQGQLTDDLLTSISQVSPDAFEHLVVNLLEKMGYGRGEAVGKSGDEGIDGIIDQDALGLEKVYMQAKRWQNQVGEPEIRNFSGSLDAKGASKGVFVTTSTFSNSAIQTAKTISAGNKFIRLIDGQELAKLMLNHDVGVITTYTYKIQALDENYFSEEL